MGTREYRSAAKGQSWKFRLMNAIDQCMRYAETREEFISLMESEGYQVRWTDSRKNITYTTPEGMKCRDDRLHEEKYTKEVMECEFGIRAEIIYRGTETSEPAAGPVRTGRAAGCPHGAELGRSAGGAHCPVPAGKNEQRPAGAPGGQRRPTGGPASGVEPAGQLSTQAQLEALARDVAQIRAELKQAGKKRERRFSLPRIRLPKLHLPYISWSSLLLGLMSLPLIGGVLWAVWSSWEKLWSAAQTMLP